MAHRPGTRERLIRRIRTREGYALVHVNDDVYSAWTFLPIQVQTATFLTGLVFIPKRKPRVRSYFANPWRIGIYTAWIRFGPNYWIGDYHRVCYIDEFQDICWISGEVGGLFPNDDVAKRTLEALGGTQTTPDDEQGGGHAN